MTDTKNWFAVEEGKVILNPVKHNIKDIDMVFSGSHGLDKAMSYDIKAKIPRKMLENNAVGAAATQGLNFLQGEASKLGIDIQQGEFINVLVNLTGSITSPKVGVNLLGMDGEEGGSLANTAKETVKEELNEKKEELEEEAQKKLDEGKAVAEKEVDKAVDSLKNVAAKEADKVIKDVGKEVGKSLDTTLTKELDKVLDDKSKETADEIKKNLEKFNPFKKKKKKKGGGK